jgi:RHS repeat-associated protein
VNKNKKAYRARFLIAVFSAVLTVFAGIINACAIDTTYLQNQVNGRYAYSVQNESGHPQYADKSNGSVVVDPLTGNLTLRETDLVLPGRDGFDLRLERYFNSSQAEFYGKKTGIALNQTRTIPANTYLLTVQVYDSHISQSYNEYYFYFDYSAMQNKKYAIDRLDQLEDTQNRFTYNYSYEYLASPRNVTFPYYYTSEIERLNYQVQHNDLGIGWSWGFPSVQPVRADHTNINSEPIGLYFHTGSGAVYTVEENAQGAYKFLEAEQDGYTFNILYNPNNDAYIIGFEYTAPNKTKYVFGERGECKSMTDIHGNTITISYSTGDYYYGNVRYTRISSITDSVGRVLSFNYYGKTTTDPYIIVTVSYPGEERTFDLVYQKRMIQGRALTANGASNLNVSAEPILMSFTNQNDEVTLYEGNITNSYTIEDFNYFTFNSKDLGGCLDYQRTSLYILFRVWYPKSMSVFEYGSSDSVDNVMRNLNVDGITEAIRVTHVYDASYTSYDGRAYEGNIYNSFYYTDNAEMYNPDYTGYPAYATAKVMPNNAYLSRIVEQYGHKQYFSYKMDTLYQPFLYLYRDELWEGYSENGLRVVNEYKDLDGKNPTLIETTVSKNGQSYTTKSQREYYNQGNSNWAERRGLIKSETRPLLSSDFSDWYKREQRKIEYDYYFSTLNLVEYNQSEGASVSDQMSYNSYNRPDTHNMATRKTEYSYEHTANSTYASSKVTKRTILDVNGYSYSDKDLKTEEFYTSATNYAYPSTIREWYIDEDGNDAYREKTLLYDMVLGKVRFITDADGTTEYRYDDMGRLTREISPTFLSNASPVAQSEYHYEKSIAYEYYTLTGYTDGYYVNPYTTTVTTRLFRYDSAGNYVLLTSNTDFYDGLGNLARNVTVDSVNNSNEEIQRDYYYSTAVNKLAKEKDPQGNITSYVYDGLSRLVQTTDAFGNKYSTAFETAITATGAKSESYFTPAGTTLKQYLVENTEDIYGRTVEKRAYGDNNQILLEKYGYDYVGNLTGYTDPNNNLNSEGVTVKYAYDSKNRLTSAKNAKNETSSVGYDKKGNILSSTVSGQRQFTKEYNKQGQIISDKDQLNKFQHYHYDDLTGRLSYHIDREGNETDFEYDSLGNATSTTAFGTSKATGYINKITTPFGADVTWDIDYQASGSYWSGAEYGNVQQNYTPTGKVREHLVQYPNYKGYTSRQYNDMGQISQLFAGYYLSSTNKGGKYTNYSYNKTRLDKVQLDGNQAPNTADAVNAKYDYYPNGALKSVSYPPLSDGRIIKSEYLYDSFNRLSSLTNSIGVAAQYAAGTSAVISKYEYSEYDNNANVKKIRETTSQGIDKTTVLCYDSLNRLISTETADGKIETYAYDNKGNRATQNTNEILFEDGSTEYRYNELNKLTHTWITDSEGNEVFTGNDYTADGLRYLKILGTTPTFYVYDQNGRVTTELSNTTNITANYIWGSDRVLEKLLQNGSKYYYLYNGHGDVVQIVNMDGEIVNSYSYDVWGNFEQKQETIHNPFTYFGQQYDDSTGLYYLRGRYYDPKTGQFTQEDPIRSDLNWYAYAGHNPICFVDPTGLEYGKVADFINEYNGTRVDNAENRSTTVTINGNSFTFYWDGTDWESGGIQYQNVENTLKMERKDFLSALGIDYRESTDSGYITSKDKSDYAWFSYILGGIVGAGNAYAGGALGALLTWAGNNMGDNGFYYEQVINVDDLGIGVSILTYVPYDYDGNLDWNRQKQTKAFWYY